MKLQQQRQHPPAGSGMVVDEIVFRSAGVVRCGVGASSNDLRRFLLSLKKRAEGVGLGV